eukprot:scaffold143619_cov18-Tisochrysis_lutea.AAC.1
MNQCATNAPIKFGLWQVLASSDGTTLGVSCWLFVWCHAGQHGHRKGLVHAGGGELINARVLAMPCIPLTDHGT